MLGAAPRSRCRLFRAFVFLPPGLCCRFETEPFNEICSFSIAGCEKITRS